MPRCYLLALTSGSSLDQLSNNVSLFNLVEQINVPPDAPPPPGGVLPLELHAYFSFAASEHGQAFELRHVLVASTGLETMSDVFEHRSSTTRLRTRTLGVPLPPVHGQYELCVDWRWSGTESWHREALTWPLTIAPLEQRPAVTH